MLLISNYGIEKTCMKGYVGNNLDVGQEWFNYKLSAARITLEKAYGRLKERWRILYKDLDCQSMERLCKIVGAACVLHNMVELEREALDLIQWNYHSARFLEPRSSVRVAIDEQADHEATLGEPREGTPEEIREAVRKYVVRTMPEGWKAPGDLS